MVRFLRTRIGEDTFDWIWFGAILVTAIPVFVVFTMMR